MKIGNEAQTDTEVGDNYSFVTPKNQN